MTGTIQILDGGLGTSLEDSYGIKFTHATPLWSSHLITSDPDTLRACQRDFVEAGADVLLTATYQVSIEGFARTATAEFPTGVPREGIGRYLRTAVDVAAEAATATAAKGGAFVALSLGPYGACMVPGQEYSGRYDDAHADEEALYRWHLERLQLFTAVDGLMERVRYVAFETLPRLDEVRAVRRAARAAGLACPFWIVCVYPGEARALPDGSGVDAVVEAMLGPAPGAATPWGVGLNCTKLPKLAGLVADYEAAWARLAARPGAAAPANAPALVLYPDGTQGEVYNTTTKTWEKPEGQDAADTDPKVCHYACARPFPPLFPT